MKRIYRIKRYFNLIEVSLALGVTALGVAGVMTLLPFAIRTSQNATNDTYLASAASLVFSGIEQKIEELKQEARKAETVKDANKFVETYEKLIGPEAGNKIGDSPSNEQDPGFFHGGARDISGWLTSSDGFKDYIVFDQESGDFADVAGRIEIGNNDYKLIGNRGLVIRFLAGKGKKPQAEFGIRLISTDINIDKYGQMDALRIFKGGSGGGENIVPSETLDEHGNIKVDTAASTASLEPTAYVEDSLRNDTDFNAEKMNDERKFYRRIYVELSWPATLPLVKRYRKYFVREYYFTDWELYKQTNGN